MKSPRTGSFALLMPADAEPNDPFPIREEILDLDFLKTVTPDNQGRILVRQHSEALFLRAHGQWREILSKRAEAHSKCWERLSEQYEDARRRLFATKATVLDPVPSLKLPDGSKRWLPFWWGLLLIAMSLLTCVNIARFAADETQDWLRAFLYAAPVLFIPFALKWADEQDSPKRWTWYRLVLAGLFVLAVAVFDLSFASRFGYAPTSEDIARGTIGRGAWDAQLQLVSQLMLDPVLALVAFFRMRESLVSSASEVPNPNYLARVAEAAKLEEELQLVALPLAQCEGLLCQFEKAKDAFADKGEAQWRQLCRLQEQADNDEREREREFQLLEKGRQERAAARDQWMASFMSAPSRNGKLSKPPKSQRFTL